MKGKDGSISKRKSNKKQLIDKMLALKHKCIHPTTSRHYIKSMIGGKDNSPEGMQVRLPFSLSLLQRQEGLPLLSSPRSLLFTPSAAQQGAGYPKSFSFEILRWADTETERHTIHIHRRIFQSRRQKVLSGEGSGAFGVCG